MKQTIGFDVYGTLVDPAETGLLLQELLGARARAFGQLWHDKKVEYAFRRGLMEQYADFGVCTLQALRYCMKVFGIELSVQAQQLLMEKFGELAAYPDVLPGLKALKAKGCHLYAFSNGTEAAVRELMRNAGILPLLDGVVSVDGVKTFKPSPRVYHHLLEHTDTTAGNCWLVSGNPWDVIGAKAAGLRGAWVRRDPAKVFDPWGIEPDRVVPDLAGLASAV